MNAFLYRHYYALLAFALFLGAARPWITLSALAAGVLGDSLRLRYGLDYAKVFQSVKDSGGRDLGPVQRGRILIPVLFVLWATYIVAFLTASLSAPETSMRSYLEWWQPFHTALTNSFYMPRTQFEDMLERGYSYRALISLHAYGIAYALMILISGVWIWFGGYPDPRGSAKLYYLKIIRGEPLRLKKYGALASFLVIMVPFLAASAVPIDFSPDGRYEFVPHLSNATLVIVNTMWAFATVCWAAIPALAKNSELGLSNQEMYSAKHGVGHSTHCRRAP